ncbi:MAG: hypothetical protein COV48_08350, partial [Elusimicrobia bacterium CG11_big_fil_rev_8_21_14_0_20_64_6]
MSPSAAGSGGAEEMSGAGYRLKGSAGEVSFTTAAAAGGSVARAGLLQVRARPGTVTGLALVALSSTSLELSWSAPGYDGELGAHLSGTRYRVQYSSTPATAFAYGFSQVSIATAGANPADAQAARVHGLWPNSTYYAQLWTQDADGNISTASNRAAVATVPRLVDSFLIKTVYVSSFTVNWPRLPLSPSSSTSEGYRLEGSTSQFAGGIIYSSTTFSVSQTTLTLSGLAPETVYYVRVISLAWDGVNGGGYPEGGVYPSTTTKFQEVPPGHVQVTPLGTGMIMSWDTVNSPQGYHLESSTSSNFTGGGNSARVDKFTVSTQLDGLLPNTTYFNRVGAVWDSGATNYASILTTATLANPPSGAAVAAVMITSITASWSAHPSSPPDASSKTAEGYVFEASANGDFSGVVFSSRSLGLGQTSLTVTGLDLNTTYYLRAGALNWQSATSYALINATATLAGVPGASPPAFTGVFVTSVATQWTAGIPANPAQTPYTIRASSMSFAPNEVEAASTTFNLADVIPGLLPDTTYQLRVRTVNPNSVYSELILGTTVTLAEVPISPAPAQVFSSSVTVAWTPVAAQGYRVEASSTNFGVLLPGGVTLSSQTSNGSSSQLTVLSLNANTTYYFRVASLNW